MIMLKPTDSVSTVSRPEVGDLLIRRVILQFRRAYKRQPVFDGGGLMVFQDGSGCCFA